MIIYYAIDNSIRDLLDRKISEGHLQTSSVFFCVVCFLRIYSGIQVSLDVPAGVTQEKGHTDGRISHPPSFCGACLYFAREKDSAIPFPRRP